MKVTLYGVRGTGPVTGPEYAVFGGETTSILVEGEGGELVAIDGGTGIRRLGGDLEKRGRAGDPILLLVTHYHLDHLMGLPAFGPLYRKGGRLTIAAPKKDRRAPEAVIRKIFSAPLWPIRFDSLPARIEFLTLEGASSTRPLARQGLRVRWGPLHHPGGSTAYRVDEPSTGASFLFATDVEWRESSPAEREAFLRLGSEPGPPDLLVFEGQYGEEEYPRFRGWGHSTRSDAMAAAELVGAGRLLITHHDPGSDDRMLRAAEAALPRGPVRAKLARQGMTVRPGGGEKR